MKKIMTLGMGFGLACALFSCSEKALELEGKYIDSGKVDRIEVRKLDGSRYTVGNKVSQLHLTREGNSLLGVTPLGDSVSMSFFPDSVEYRIMGTLTIYHQMSAKETEE